MQIARISYEGPDGPEPRVVVASDVEPNRWVDVRAAEGLRRARAGATPAAARRLAAVVVPGSLTEALDTGEAFMDAALAALQTEDEACVVPPMARFLAPVDPPAYRDFMAFEAHFRPFYERQGREPPDVMYELPISYMGSVQALLGPEDEVAWPAYSNAIDFELELGIVLGRPGRNLTPEEAHDHILGFTVFNDFSARDMLRRELAGQMGPCKGKNFASAVGPRIVTTDAIDPMNLEMTARANGETWSKGSTSSLLWSVDELVAWASTGENLAAGTLLGTGTVGGGSAGGHGYLSPGDAIELEIEHIGVLRNRIGRDPRSDWLPQPRHRAAKAGK